MITDELLGRRVRQRRKVLGWTQTDLGERVGVRFQQIQKYETAQNRMGAVRLAEIAEAMEVPVAYFFEVVL